MPPTHATVATFTMDPAREAEQRAGLDAMIVPGVRRHPGFVSGTWTRDREAGTSTVLLTFESVGSAEAMAADVRANAEHQAAVGIVLQDVRVVEVEATAVAAPDVPHTVTAVGAVLDCADPDALADFWQAAVGFTVRTGDGRPYVTLSGAPIRRPLNHLTLQRVPEPKSGKNRVHLDLFARGAQAEVERLVGLGATVLDELRDGDVLLYATLADPEGNELCVVSSPSRG